MITQDILEILLLLLVASLIAGFIVWLYMRSRWKMVSEERNWYSQKLTETENQYNNLLTQSGQLEISNQDLVKNLNAATAHSNSLASDLQGWKLRYDDLSKKVEEQQNRITFLAPFEAQSQTLTANLQAAETTMGQLNGDIAALNQLKASLEQQINDLNAKLKAQTDQNGELNVALQTTQGNINQLNTHIDGLNVDIAALNQLKTQLNEQIAQLQAQKQGLENDLLANQGQLNAATAVQLGLTNQLDNWQSKYVEQADASSLLSERAAELEALANKRADLNAELQTELNALKVQLDAANEAVALSQAQYDAAIATQVGVIHDLQTSGLQQTNHNNSGDLAHITQEYETLEAMYAELQAELNDCRNNQQTTAATALNSNTATTTDDDKPSWWRPAGEVQNPPALTNAATNVVVDFDRIGTATADEKDDLLIIKGIGPFIETRLHNLGIYTFRQIANFNAQDIEKVNAAIEVFAGRIERERWVDQARDFASNRELKSETDRLLSKVPLIDFERIGRATEAEKDSLESLKGIGTLIEKQLNQLGIYTFAQLAKFNAHDIAVISDAVVLYPGRIEREQWVEQAKERLAAAG